MKTESELINELRAGLAHFANSRLKFRPVFENAFPHLDLAFYRRCEQQFLAAGFARVGDFVIDGVDAGAGDCRCFLRTFLSPDGAVSAACYHPKPRLPLRLLAWALLGPLNKTVELDTEFSDDSFITTTTMPKARLFDPPPLLIRDHMRPDTTVAKMIEWHRQRVNTYLSINPGVQIRRVFDSAGLERAQNRNHDIVAVYRTIVGGLSAEEIERFSGLGKAKSTAIKKALDASISNSGSPAAQTAGKPEAELGVVSR